MLRLLFLFLGRGCLVECGCVISIGVSIGIIIVLSRALGGFPRRGYSSSFGVENAGFADTFALDGLHGRCHVDVEFISGFATLGRFGFVSERVGGVREGCGSGESTP